MFILVLWNGGKTGLIKRFKSRSGKSYSAYLVLKEDGKLGMELKKKVIEIIVLHEGEVN